MAKRVTTLYLGDDAINLLVADSKRIMKWASARLEPGLVSQGIVLDEAAVAEQIDKLFKVAKIRTRRVIVGLSGLNSIYRLISLPQLPKALIPEAIRHEARRVIPAPFEEIYLSYQILSSSPGETRVFLAAYPRNVADTLMKALRRANVRPYSMDLAPLALCRNTDETRAIIVYAKSDHMAVMVMEDRLPQLIRWLYLPGEVASLAEKLPAITEEVDRTIAFYNSGHKLAPLDAEVPMLVCGDLTTAQKSWPALASKLGCPVSILPSPLQYPRHFDPDEFPVNIGLALKAVLPPKKATSFSVVNINALPEVYLPRAVHLGNILFPVGIIAAAALLAYMGFLVHQKTDDNSTLRPQVTAAESRLTEEQQKAAELKLAEKIAQAEADTAAVQTIANVLDTTLTSSEAGRVQVDGELAEIVDLLPESISLTTVDHTGASVTVIGTATDEDDIFRYARDLRARFPGVVINSITAIEAEEGAGGFSFQLLLK